MNQREKAQQVQTAKLREILNLFHEIDDQDSPTHSIAVIDQAASGGSIALLVGPPERPRAELWLRADLDAERVIWTSDVPGQPKRGDPPRRSLSSDSEANRRPVPL
jgi:hypothetical protein